MIYRIAFSVIPMICGLLLFSGAIPIGSLISGAPASGRAEGLNKASGLPSPVQTASPLGMLRQAAEAERMVRNMERGEAEARRRRVTETPGAGRPGWAPQGGWGPEGGAR